MLADDLSEQDWAQVALFVVFRFFIVAHILRPEPAIGSALVPGEAFARPRKVPVDSRESGAHFIAQRDEVPLDSVHPRSETGEAGDQNHETGKNRKRESQKRPWHGRDYLVYSRPAFEPPSRCGLALD